MEHNHENHNRSTPGLYGTFKITGGFLIIIIVVVCVCVCVLVKSLNAKTDKRQFQRF